MIFVPRKLKLALVISIAWHLFWFNALEFSFKKPVLQKPYNLFFLGSFLDRFDFSFPNVGFDNVKIPLIRLKEEEMVLSPKYRQLKSTAFSGGIKNASYGFSALTADIIKPYLFYPAVNEADYINLTVVSRDSGISDKTRQLIQKLPNPFFYKEILPAGIVVETVSLPSGNGFLVKRLISSGDLEVDLLAIKALRRRLYLGGPLEGRRVKRIKVELENND